MTTRITTTKEQLNSTSTVAAVAGIWALAGALTIMPVKRVR